MEKSCYELVEGLEKNNNGSVKMDSVNVEKILNFIIDNEISNVSYFITKDLHLGLSSFYNGIKRYKLINPSFYCYYLEKVNFYNNRVHDNIYNALLYIGILMDYGIELEDGSFRKFDEFDLLKIKNEYFDNINRKNMSKILEEFSKDPIIEELGIKFYNIRALISKSFSDSLYTYSDPIHKDVILNDKFSGLTKEELIWLVNYMESNNIAFNHNNYQFGIKKMKEQRKNPNNLFELDLYMDNYKKTYVRKK